MEIRLVFDPGSGRVECHVSEELPGTVLKVLETALRAHKDRMFESERQGPVLLAPPGARLPPLPNGGR